MAPFEIPAEFQDKLETVEVKDNRTQEEIVETLKQHVAVSSEKNIWAYWHAGVAELPGWSKRNVVDWVRMLGPEWTVRVLDTVPGSPNNALKWLPASDLPECFVKGTMDGQWKGQHSADILRGGLLYHYGGVWMDVGCLLIRHVERIGWSKLEDPESPYRVAIAHMLRQQPINSFVMARKGDPFILRW
jgi:hypothetical protein